MKIINIKRPVVNNGQTGIVSSVSAVDDATYDSLVEQGLDIEVQDEAPDLKSFDKLKEDIDDLVNIDLGKVVYAPNLYSINKRFVDVALVQSANCLNSEYKYSYSGTEVIGYFPCEVGTYDIIYNGSLYKSFAFVMSYDMVGNPTGRLTNNNGQFTTSSKGYFCLQTNTNSSIDVSKLAIVKHFDGIDYSMIGETTYRFIEKQKQSKLHGKKIAVLGDSITSVDYTVPNWWQMIEEETGCIVTNYGVSGTSIAYNEDREQFEHCFAQRYTDMADDFDIIFVMGGTNDQNRSKLGNYKDTDYNTFYGAMNVLLQGLITKYPNKTILFATPIQMRSSWTSGYNNCAFVYFNNGGISATSTMSVQMIAEAIKQKCRQLAIPCKNLFDESGINGFDGTDFINDDTLHPSVKGQKKLKVAIQNFWESHI